MEEKMDLLGCLNVVASAPQMIRMLVRPPLHTVSVSQSSLGDNMATLPKATLAPSITDYH